MTTMLVNSFILGTPAAPFSPTDIAGLTVWLKADTGLFQDTAKTTPASSASDPIGAWADQSGLGHDLFQATSGKRPTLNLAVINGRNVVHATAASDQALQATFTRGQPHTIIVVIGASSANNYVADGMTNNTGVLQLASGTVFRAAAFTALNLTVTDTSAPAIVGAKFNNTSSTVTHGALSATGPAGALNAGGLTLFNAGDQTSAPFNGDIAEVICYDTAISDVNYNLVTGYLATRFALTGSAL